MTVTTTCANLHNGDLVAYDTKRGAVCTLDDLHAQQAEFPHCIPDGIFILHEDCKPGDDRPVVGLDDHVVEFEITPNRPTASIIAHPGRPPPPLTHPWPSTSRW